jgi:predicted dehydrogenase
MLRVAIVGCGKIADQHMQAIQRIPHCKIVSLCDQELLMARQLGERSGVSECFSDLAVMLKSVSPDIVHITTPPQSHFSLAQQCLKSGSHVYLEKPFTVTAREAEALIQLAETRNLKMTAGHNLQFTPEMLQMRRLVKEEFLGGRPVHVESHWTYDLGDTNYVGPMLGSRAHWVRQLPGQLFHNIISHGIAKLSEFLDDDITEIQASAHQSPRLQALGGEEVLDELRVHMRDKAGTTAYFCFSTQIKPGLNHLLICGPRNSIMVDHGCGAVVRNRDRGFKSYLTFFVPPLLGAWEHLGNARHNFANFLGRKLYQDSGMTELINCFYNSIQTEGPPPIPYREIILTARIMDEIFAQIYGDRKASGQLERIQG